MGVRETVMKTIDTIVGLVRCCYDGYTVKYSENDMLTLLPVCY